jgi:hypothetical protein
LSNSQLFLKFWYSFMLVAGLCVVFFHMAQQFQWA